MPPSPQLLRALAPLVVSRRYLAVSATARQQQHNNPETPLFSILRRKAPQKQENYKVQQRERRGYCSSRSTGWKTKQPPPLYANFISSSFSLTAPPKTIIRHHGGGPEDTSKPLVTFLMLKPSKNADTFEELMVSGRVGENVLRAAQRHGVELEGACEGVCACSTCHVIVEDATLFSRLPEASEDEEDMLDMAFGLEETSRLSCQVELDESMEGMRLRLPAATRNFYVDGHVPQPH